LTEEDEERGALLGRGQREELGNLKRGGAERAGVVREDGAIKQPLDLGYCGLQERFVGSAMRERMGILGIVLATRRVLG